jgi:hypothetical protein
MKENRSYLQRYAMLFGTYMGSFWILKFIIFPIGLTVPFLLLMFAGLTLAVPFVGYYYAKTYRNQACGGYISFFHAWMFSLFMYLFAALLTAVAHFIYFRYIDQGYILSTYSNILNNLPPETAKEMGDYIALLKDSLNVVRGMSPIEITMQLVSQNVFYGSLIAIPTALFVMKKEKKSE